MASLLSPETFEFFARYLLAGYIVIFVRSAFILGLRPKPTELLIEAVILSLVAQMLLVGIEGVYVLSKTWPFVKDHMGSWYLTPSDRSKFAIRVLLVPALLGVLLGKFLQSNWRNGILKRLSMPVVHPVRKAHDFAFGNERGPGFIEITYEDGTKIAGWFGQESLAATDDQRSDLYLERTYLIGDDGNWSEPSTPRASLINLKSVRSIEFLLEAKETK